MELDPLVLPLAEAPLRDGDVVHEVALVEEDHVEQAEEDARQPERDDRLLVLEERDVLEVDVDGPVGDGGVVRRGVVGVVRDGGEDQRDEDELDDREADDEEADEGRPRRRRAPHLGAGHLPGLDLDPRHAVSPVFGVRVVGVDELHEDEAGDHDEQHAGQADEADPVLLQADAELDRLGAGGGADDLARGGGQAEPPPVGRGRPNCPQCGWSGASGTPEPSTSLTKRLKPTAPESGASQSTSQVVRVGSTWVACLPSEETCEMPATASSLPAEARRVKPAWLVASGWFDSSNLMVTWYRSEE